MNKKSTLLFLFVLFVIILPLQTVFAEGPGTGGRRVRLENERAGDYFVRAVISPTPPRVENFYVEIQLKSALDEALISDALIVVRAIPLKVDGEAAIVRGIATHDIAPVPTEYAVHLPVAAPGDWQVEININGPLGEQQVVFQERISSPNRISGVLSIGAPFAGLAVLGLVFYLMQRKQKEDESQQTD